MHVANGYSVDKDLYSYMLNHHADSTSTTHQRLSIMATDKCLDNSMFYYKAVQLGKIESRNVHGLERDQQQNTRDYCLVHKDNEPSKDMKRMRSTERELKLARMDFQQPEARFHGNLEFIDIFKFKLNRNKTNLPFKGLGKKKLLLCVDHGIATVKELIAYDGTNPKILPQWRDAVQNYYDKLEWQITTVLSKMERLEKNLSGQAWALPLLRTLRT